MVADHALEARGAGVAVALEHAAERLRTGAQVRAPAVVLEAGEHARAVEAGKAHLDRDVADEPRPGLAHRVQIDEPDPGDALVAELVVVAEELVAAAHGEDDAAGVGRVVQRVALGVDHVLGAQRLVAVLRAADVEEVMRGGVDPLAEPRGDDLEADRAPRAAALEQQQVAAVGVDVHEVGIQRADAQRALSHGASPPSSPRTRASGGSAAAAAARRPTATASSASSSGSTRSSSIDVVADVVRVPSIAHDLTDAIDRRAVAEVADGLTGRLA